MVLHPLAEVGIGVLMAIVVGRSQLVMNVLRHRERGKPEEDTDYSQYHSRTEQAKEAPGLYRQRQHDVRKTLIRLCKRH
jgi:hypothetical protein